MQNCETCGRYSCRCGTPVPSRICPKHKQALIIISIPTWEGNGTPDEPHRIVAWHEYLNCAVSGCGYARSLKSPTGTRTDNRKQGTPEPNPIIAAKEYFRAKISKSETIPSELGKRVSSEQGRNSKKRSIQRVRIKTVSPKEAQKRLTNFINKFDARILSVIDKKEKP